MPMKRTVLALPLLGLLAACGSSGSPVARATQPAAKPPPFGVKVGHCGTLTPAERDRFGANEKAGAIVTVTRVGAGEPLQPQLTVDFLHGTSVETENYSGNGAPFLALGESVQLEVGNVTDGGASGDAADACKVVSVQAFQRGSQTPVGTWYPG